MKQRIFLSIALVGTAMALITTLLGGIIFQDVMQQITINGVRQLGSVLYQEMELELSQGRDMFALVDTIRDVRLSIIDETGKVIFDNQIDTTTLANHNDRVEVVEARSDGYGESVRRSDSMGSRTNYFAKQLSNQMVVRLAKDTSGWLVVLSGYTPVFLLAFLFLMAISLFVSFQLSKRIIQPIETMALHVNDVAVPYRELLPFQQMIREQNEQIAKQYVELNVERDKLIDMMNHMQEGFLTLDEEFRIMSINPAAISLLQAREDLYLQKSILSLTRNKEIHDCLLLAKTQDHQSMIVLIGDQYIRVIVNTIYKDGYLDGIMVFLLDVTELQITEKIRREFTSNVSHELKTPLTSISGFSEMIASDLVTNLIDAKTFATKIFMETTRLKAMVSQILRLSEIEEQKKKVFTTVNLANLISICIDQLQLVANQKNVTIVFDGNDVWMDGNDGMLHELVYNLIDNAIKYSTSFGLVSITLSQNLNRAQMHVKDNGIGIAKKDQGRIFERFYTVDKSHSKSQSGTGLGLSIVKHVVEFHSGNIVLHSEEGSGSEFIVDLPLKQ